MKNTIIISLSMRKPITQIIPTSKYSHYDSAYFQADNIYFFYYSRYFLYKDWNYRERSSYNIILGNF